MAVNQAAVAAKLTAGIQAVNETISTVGELNSSRPDILSTVYAVVKDALIPFVEAIAAYDADIDTGSVGGVVKNLPAPQLAAVLLNQTKSVEQQARLVIAEAFLSRVGVNLNNAPG